MTSEEKLHFAIRDAIVTAVKEGMTPDEIADYFDRANRGLKVNLAFRPNSELFLEMITTE